ncbi:LINE-1 retrotransposable element ORF1 protein [Plecturocebus cupreus]
MDNLERNISELMELKNTIREVHEACTSFNSRIDQAEERISEVEDQLNEIKREGKIREERVKRNEQSLQEIWDYVKRPNLHLIGVPECDEENESKLENTLQDIIQENFPNLARQANIQIQEIQRTPQRYSSTRATPRHIIVIFTRVEMKEKMLRAAREKGRVTHKGKPIRLTVDLSAETLQARREPGDSWQRSHTGHQRDSFGRQQLFCRCPSVTPPGAEYTDGLGWSHPYKENSNWKRRGLRVSQQVQRTWEGPALWGRGVHQRKTKKQKKLHHRAEIQDGHIAAAQDCSSQ